MLKDSRMHASTPRFIDLIILAPLATIQRLFSLHMPQAFHYLVQSESMPDKHVRTDPRKVPMRCYGERRKKRPASRKQSQVQPHKHASKQGYATQSEAEPNTTNPQTGRETGLHNCSRGPGEAAHGGPASGTRRDMRARPTQERVRVFRVGLAEPFGILAANHDRLNDRKLTTK
jgi:hypothetical protein